MVGIMVALGSSLAAGDALAEPSPPSRGLAVVAEGDTGPFAASLARAVYGDPGLLPPTLDDGRARALAGGYVAPDAPDAIRDLAETRAALHGDDAPTRRLLGALATSLHLKALVVVEGRAHELPSARVFLAGSGAFDATVYQPDPSAVVTWGSGASVVTWAGAVSALHGSFADAVAPATNLAPAPVAALAPTPAAVPGEKTPGSSRPFYASPWFWGALGAAAFAGAAFYFATRDSSAPNIQLQVQVPR